MVDNLALLFAHLAMIVVLWRCYVMPEDDRAESTDAEPGDKKPRTRASARKVKFRA